MACKLKGMSNKYKNSSDEHVHAHENKAKNNQCKSCAIDEQGAPMYNSLWFTTSKGDYNTMQSKRAKLKAQQLKS